MKKIFLSIFVALTAITFLYGDAAARLPQTYKEFKERYQTEAKTPEGALKLHFEAVFSYINPETRAEAGKMLRYSMYLDMPLERSRVYATFVERMKDPEEIHIFRSFATGATPQNSYKMSPDNFTLNIVGLRENDGYLKLGLQSSGADSVRWIWMREHDGLWYTENNAGIYVQIRKPQSQIDAKKHAHDADYDYVPSKQPVNSLPANR